MVWTERGARLLDYGGAGPVVLFVPSLINRWTVLDLMSGHSMVRWLAASGVHPLLLDWGPPEPDFSLTDYIAGRLTRALSAAATQGDAGRAILAGYCMGGTFATAVAAARPDLVRALILLAAPWDFHAGGGDLPRRIAAGAVSWPKAGGLDVVPVDWLQTLFAVADPDAIAAKFRRFRAMAQNSEAARLFVAIEDWLNDGVALGGSVARECLRDWYGANLPMAGAWRIAGLAIDPTGIAMPTLAAVPDRDRIVPPDSALALARLLPGATLLRPGGGHVGMMAGRGAPDALWAPVRDWILAHGAAPGRPRRPRRGDMALS